VESNNQSNWKNVIEILIELKPGHVGKVKGDGDDADDGDGPICHFVCFCLFPVRG